MIAHHAVTIVGTLKKNKAEIPPTFLELRGREKNTAMFAFSGVQTLLSYCPPKHKKKVGITANYRQVLFLPSIQRSKKPNKVPYL